MRDVENGALSAQSAGPAISPSLCNACGICLAVCPQAILEVGQNDKKPIVNEQTRKRCIACGQCEAFCPENAVTVTGPALRGSTDVDLDQSLTESQIRSVFMRRRSIRNFKAQPVAREVFEKLIDIVQYAPSAVNRQPLSWSVLLSKDKVREAAQGTIDFARSMLESKSALAAQLNFVGLITSWEQGKDPICRNAPSLVVAHAPKADRMAVTDGVIALTHIELAASAIGLGACWAGYLNIAAGTSPTVKEALGIPEDHSCLGALMIGYPQFKMVRIPKRKAPSINWH
jgi:nitroreductase/NAD-dependent dihydropyrimidine dehydrogenase PreA subunit